jgi:hypothetical protein
MCALWSRLTRAVVCALLGAAFLVCAPFGAGCVGPGLEPPGDGDNAGIDNMTPRDPDAMDGGSPTTGGAAGASSGAGGTGGGPIDVNDPDAASEDSDGGVDADEDAGPLR